MKIRPPTEVGIWAATDRLHCPPMSAGLARASTRGDAESSFPRKHGVLKRAFKSFESWMKAVKCTKDIYLKTAGQIIPH